MTRDGHNSNTEGLKRVNKERALEAKQKYEGMEFKTKYGTPFVIKEYIGGGIVIIEFPFSGIQKKIYLFRIMKNPPIVGDPFYRNNGHHKPFVFENPADEFIGQVFQNMNGEKFKIVEYKNYNDITIEFLDEYKYKAKTHYDKIEKGSIKNPYRINADGGFSGEGTLYRGSEFKWLNCIWHSMLIRSNNQEKLHERNVYNYDNCRVCPEWENYSIFSVDYMNKLSQLNPNFSYELDKDLLYEKYKDKTGGFKYYSNDTTVLLPDDINNRLERAMNSKLLIPNQYEYLWRYENLINWKEKVIWYWNNNGMAEIAYINLLELIDSKIEEMKQKFPEFEAERIRRLNDQQKEGLQE